MPSRIVDHGTAPFNGEMPSGDGSRIMEIDIAALDFSQSLTSVLRRGLCSGGAIVISKPGECRRWSDGHVSLTGRHPVTENTRFPIGCVSEVVLALVGSELESRRRFAWDEPISRYIPEAKTLAPELRTRLTARRLLAHSSGLDYGHIGNPGAASISSLLGGGFYFSPGQFYSRTIYNTQLLHLVLDRIEPGCVVTFLQTRLGLQTPSRMLHSTEVTGYLVGRRIRAVKSHELDPTPHQVALSVMQIARCGLLFAAGMPPRGTGSVDDAPMSRLLAKFPYVVDDTLSPYAPPWYRSNEAEYRCGGHYPGYNVLLMVWPQSKLSLAIASNSDSRELNVGVLKSLYAARFRAAGPRLADLIGDAQAQDRPRTWHTCIDAAHLRGSYAAHGQTLTVSVGGSGLYLSGVEADSFPPIRHKRSRLHLQSNGYFTTSANPTSSRTAIRFIDTASSAGASPWMRMGELIYRKVSDRP